MVRSIKEMGLPDKIDVGVKTMLDFGTKDMMPHLIWCFGYFIWDEKFEIIKKIILKKMQEYGIQSSLFTMLNMVRENLITKEKSKQGAEGKLKHELYWEVYKGSINDDLDSFITKLQNSDEMGKEEVWSFFTPKLTKEELKLVKEKNKEHMMTYQRQFYADVGVGEMKKSNSKDKYVHTRCLQSIYL